MKLFNNMFYVFQGYLFIFTKNKFRQFSFTIKNFKHRNFDYAFVNYTYSFKAASGKFLTAWENTRQLQIKIQDDII